MIKNYYFAFNRHAIRLGVVAGLIIAGILSVSASVRNDMVATLDDEVYTLKEAGLQFVIPSGWKQSIDADKNVVLSFGDGSATVTMMTEDEYAAVMAGMKKGLHDNLTEFKTEGEPSKDKFAGMDHISETGTGKAKTIPIRWRIDVLQATKNVVILTYGPTKEIDAHSEDYGKFVSSIKRL